MNNLNCLLLMKFMFQYATFTKDLEFDRLDDFKYGICLIENELRDVLLSPEILFCEWYRSWLNM